MPPAPPSPLRTVFAARPASLAARSPRSPQLGFISHPPQITPRSRTKSYHPLLGHARPSPLPLQRSLTHLEQQSTSLPISVSLPVGLNLFTRHAPEGEGSGLRSILIRPDTPKGPESPHRVNFAPAPPAPPRVSRDLQSPLMKRDLTPMPRSHNFTPTLSASQSSPTFYSTSFDPLPPHGKLRKPRRDLPSPISTSQSTVESSTTTEASTSLSSHCDSSSQDGLNNPISFDDAEYHPQDDAHQLDAQAHNLNPASLTRRLGLLFLESRTPTLSSPILSSQSAFGSLHQHELTTVTELRPFERSLTGETAVDMEMDRGWSMQTETTDSEQTSSASTTSSVLTVEDPVAPHASPVPPSLGSSRISSAPASSFAKWRQRARAISEEAADEYKRREQAVVDELKEWCRLNLKYA